MPNDYVRTNVPDADVPRVEKQIKDQAAIDRVIVTVTPSDNGDGTFNLTVTFGTAHASGGGADVAVPED